MLQADENLREVDARRRECDTLLQREMRIYNSARSLSARAPPHKDTRAQLRRILAHCRFTYVAPAGNVAFHALDLDIQVRRRWRRSQFLLFFWGGIPPEGGFRPLVYILQKVRLR